MNTLSEALFTIKHKSQTIEKSQSKDTNMSTRNNGPVDFDSMLKNNLETSEPQSRKIDKKLMDTCVEMESIFVAKMLKEMRKTVHKSEWINGGFAEEVFEDMLYDKYALSISKESNMGMAKMLYDQLSRK